MKVYRNGKSFKAIKANRAPSFDRKHTGKTTWLDTSVLINGKQTSVHWECMRGAYYYFHYNNQWYKAPFIIGWGSNAIDNLNDDIQYEEEWIIEKKG